ncbi:MAG TPA: hypothetical protein VN808_12640 [Stellaceae bacterium]|nr:hypothetical protein [Stellaceae bacterium]
MRFRAWVSGLLCLAACSSTPSDASKVTLHNSEWNHVNVQIVITRSANCDDRGPEFVGSQDLVMHKDESKTVIALNGTSVCWRHDRFPNKPNPGEWSGWSRAIPFPGENTTTDL